MPLAVRIVRNLSPFAVARAGLPATVTSLLSLTCAKLVKQNVYVKENEMVEALGSTSVICSDKTGTLTKNQLRCGLA